MGESENRRECARVSDNGREGAMELVGEWMGLRARERANE